MNNKDISTTIHSDSNYVQFVFFGRLDEEKGWDLLIHVRKRLIQEHKNNKNNLLDRIRFLVFGDGEYRKQVLNLGAIHGNISYFGRKPLQQIERYIAASDYTLMPSTFLETFGLSALESLSLGVPVIGFRKGGLVPFIQEQGDINQYPGKTNEEKLYNCIKFCVEHSNVKKKQEMCERASKQSLRYTQTRRIQNFHQLIQTNNRHKKILLISDYATQLYGIESHIHGLKELLEQHGYTVEIYGAHVRKNSRNKLLRVMMLPMTIANRRATRGIKKRINALEPDIIRRHSTSRRLGRLPLWATRSRKGQQRMTYHDLGYFHPFPHKVTELAQIPDRTLSHYLKAGKTNNPITLLAMICKFILHSSLKKQTANNIDKHFVPSAFMLPLVQKRLGSHAKGKVMLLEHYKKEHK